MHLFPKLTAATLVQKLSKIKSWHKIYMVIMHYACKFALIISGNLLTNINLTIVFSPLLVNPARLASLISLAKINFLSFQFNMF